MVGQLVGKLCLWCSTLSQLCARTNAASDAAGRNCPVCDPLNHTCCFASAAPLPCTAGAAPAVWCSWLPCGGTPQGEPDRERGNPQVCVGFHLWNTAASNCKSQVVAALGGTEAASVCLGDAGKAFSFIYMLPLLPPDDATCCQTREISILHL